MRIFAALSFVFAVGACANKPVDSTSSAHVHGAATGTGTAAHVHGAASGGTAHACGCKHESKDHSGCNSKDSCPLHGDKKECNHASCAMNKK